MGLLANYRVIRPIRYGNGGLAVTLTLTLTLILILILKDYGIMFCRCIEQT